MDDLHLSYCCCIVVGFHLGFEMGGGGIIDNVAVGGGCVRGMCTPPPHVRHENLSLK